jgi:rare lipoprotein A
MTLAALGILSDVGLAADGGAAQQQTGDASFFGSGLEGQETASGEIFDADELVAAHPSHPAGTVLRVTNLENRRSTEVRVVDRGPSREERSEGVVIDVSRAAAERLGFKKDGKARVRVEVVKPGS